MACSLMSKMAERVQHHPLLRHLRIIVRAEIEIVLRRHRRTRRCTGIVKRKTARAHAAETSRQQRRVEARIGLRRTIERHASEASVRNVAAAAGDQPRHAASASARLPAWHREGHARFGGAEQIRRHAAIGERIERPIAALAACDRTAIEIADRHDAVPAPIGEIAADGEIGAVRRRARGIVPVLCAR